MKKDLDYLDRKKVLSKNNLNLLKRILNKLYFDKKITPVLTHQDLCEEHILIKNGKISGIIDLADIKSDDAMSDFRRIAKENEKYLPFVIKGYGKVNAKRIELHRFILFLAIIVKLHKRKELKRMNYFIEKIKLYTQKNMKQ
jgi:aminoglycoside phosphotransferase